MGRVEEGYRDLLLETMKDWKNTAKPEGTSLRNNLDAQNNFIDLVNTLETFLYPKLLQYGYQPPTGDNLIETGHLKMRAMMVVCQKADLITPYEIHDAGKWDSTNMDMEPSEQVE